LNNYLVKLPFQDFCPVFSMYKMITSIPWFQSSLKFIMNGILIL
jgi:hypothetical protein